MDIDGLPHVNAVGLPAISKLRRILLIDIGFRRVPDLRIADDGANGESEGIQFTPGLQIGEPGKVGNDEFLTADATT